MDRRRVLLVVAAIIAALGTLLVVLYVRGADDRANEKFNAVKVLTVTKQINPGETVAAAQAAGKIELGSVAEGQRLPGSLDSLSPIEGQIAQTTLYPGEQVIAAKFATTVATGNNLTIPKGSIAISLNLTDTGRVAGFVNPGDKVAIFLTTPAFTRLLLNDVEVIAVGATAVVPTTTTDASGNQTTEQLPRTLFTVGVTQAQAEKILYATNGGSGGGQVAFGLLNKDSEVRPGPGTSADSLFK
ncbi:MAG: Flp pilus assembly protein CpaB [Nocardioidaceae bacterium]|nr:Flp pilus assembly protein CpaB [Nocardioidaceae bacterium]